MNNKILDDFSYKDLDPGIRETVRWLRSWGYITTDSGDGKTKIAAGDMEALPYSHVFISLYDLDFAKEEADRLWHYIQAIGLPEAIIEISYSPKDKKVILALIGVDDEMLKDKI